MVRFELFEPAIRRFRNGLYEVIEIIEIRSRRLVERLEVGVFLVEAPVQLVEASVDPIESSINSREALIQFPVESFESAFDANRTVGRFVRCHIRQSGNAEAVPSTLSRLFLIACCR